MNELIDGILRSTPDDLGRAMLHDIAAGELQGFVPDVTHYHAAGLYGRRIFVPANCVVVTLKHLQQHLTIALTGRCTVVDEQGNRTEVVAPAVWVTEAGTQRSVYTHEDTEWITVHQTDVTDVAELERTLVVDTLADEKQKLAAQTGGRLT